MTADIHTCSYYCERPECVRRQRDELRDRLEADLAQQPAAPSGAAASAEPAVWVAADTLHSPHPVCISSLAYMSQLDRERGREYVPLYTATQQSAGVTEEMVERAAEAAWPEFKSGLEERIWLRAPVVRKDRLRIIVRTALTAALAAQHGGRDHG